MGNSCTNFSFFMFVVGMFTLWCYYPWSSKENEERCEVVMTAIDRAIDCTVVRWVVFFSIWSALGIGYCHAMYLS